MTYERSELKYPSKPEAYENWHEYFRDYKQTVAGEKLVAEKPKQFILVPGHEVDLDAVIKRTKTGGINTQSTLGKIAKAALDSGWTLVAGESEYMTPKEEAKVWRWISGGYHGYRFTVNDLGCQLNGQPVEWKKLKAIVEENVHV